jgi:ubiquinone/menaquinone biosynthesis C-methylase UbiE
MDMMLAFQRSAALKTGIELELFTRIGEGNVTIEQIATACGASRRGIRILCDYLVVAGLLTKNDKQYGLAPDAAAFLDKRSPAYLGGTSRFLQSEELRAAFHDLTPTVRNGTTTLPDRGTAKLHHPVWVEFARSMGPMMFQAAQEIAAIVAGTGSLDVLDIAAGHGLFGVMVAQRNAQARVVALDSRPVLDVAAENAAKFGVADRWQALEGDAFDVDFRGPYDIVLVPNFFHHFDPADCERVMRKIRAALKPGGRCVTLEFVPNEDRVSPPMPANFALMMLGGTEAGDAYTLSEYERMFSNAGFARTEMRELEKAPQRLLISTL